MILNTKSYVEEAAKKNITEQQLETFFKIGLELNIFRVVGNEGSNLIYETNDNQTATGNEVLLNEQGEKNPVEIKTMMLQKICPNPKKQRKAVRVQPR